jgi:outer membrane protein TolC
MTSSTRSSHIALNKTAAPDSRQALAPARPRYTDGVTEFLSVLDAERTLRQAEQQDATSTTNISLNLVQVFKALGSGWN